jgi:hypothetical protein
MGNLPRVELLKGADCLPEQALGLFLSRFTPERIIMLLQFFFQISSLDPLNHDVMIDLVLVVVVKLEDVGMVDFHLVYNQFVTEHIFSMRFFEMLF